MSERKPRLLDLFCGAGGAAMGYHWAGFEVVGVDIKPQPHYPFEFIQGDALGVLRDVAKGWQDLDAIHASPPCHDHVRALGGAPKDGTGWLLGASRDLLETTGLPWVIENVPGASMRADYKLCGCMFNLPRLKRDRWFETSWQGFEMRSPCYHPERVISVTGTGTPTGTWEIYGSLGLRDFQKVLGIDWMNRNELSQAIPPAYTEHIGHYLTLEINARKYASSQDYRGRDLGSAEDIGPKSEETPAP